MSNENMERRISSSFTEFYKVYGIFSVLILVAFVGLPFFNPFDWQFSVFMFAALFINLFFAFDFWQMKEVEITEAGLIITDRFFFTQKTIFIPFEQIESVNNKLWWLGNNRRTSIKFTENTKFGKEISFISKGFTRTTQAEIIEELNRTIIRSKRNDRINAAFHQLDN